MFLRQAAKSVTFSSFILPIALGAVVGCGSSSSSSGGGHGGTAGSSTGGLTGSSSGTGGTVGTAGTTGSGGTSGSAGSGGSAGAVATLVPSCAAPELPAAALILDFSTAVAAGGSASFGPYDS